MLLYKVREEKRVSEDGVAYTGYSLDLYVDGELSGNIEDVATNKDFAERIVALLNKNSVEFEQAQYIVEDIVAEASTVLRFK